MNIRRWGLLGAVTESPYHINLLIHKQIFIKDHCMESLALWTVVSERPQMQTVCSVLCSI